MSAAVGVLVLAAGAARRMGAAKLAMAIDGEPVIVRTLAAVAAAGLPALVVTGAHRAAVEAAIASASDAAAQLMPRVHAPDADAGLSASLRTGLAALPQDWGAVLVMLGDMPFVRPETLAMLAARLADGAGAVVPVHRDRRGNPAGFARRHWPRLMALSGDRGASALLDPLRAVEVPVSDPGILLDLDRPEDLARFRATFTAVAPPGCSSGE